MTKYMYKVIVRSIYNACSKLPPLASTITFLVDRLAMVDHGICLDCSRFFNIYVSTCNLWSFGWLHGVVTRRRVITQKTTDYINIAAEAWNLCKYLFTHSYFKSSNERIVSLENETDVYVTFMTGNDLRNSLIKLRHVIFILWSR
jgi:hypothetical protein